MAFDQGIVGPGNPSTSDGNTLNLRQGRQGDLDVSELHGRFYEQNFRGNLYSVGMSLTAINNATFTIGTTGNTNTPILGIWNPSTSTINAVILQASLVLVQTALTNTGPGGFVWAGAVGQTAISAGIASTNRKTLATGGGQAKGFNASPALTGLTGAIATLFGSGISGGSPYNISSVGTAVGFPPSVNSEIVESFDGSVIVPPGGLLVLVATTTPAAHSAVGSLLWEEVPVN